MQRMPSDFRVTLYNGKQITEDWIEPTFTLRLSNTAQIKKWDIYWCKKSSLSQQVKNTDRQTQAHRLLVPSEGFLC
jgi:hypothetical protein